MPAPRRVVGLNNVTVQDITMSKHIFKATLLGAAAALSVGVGTFVTAAPAEAQIVTSGPVYRTGAFRGGYVGPRVVTNHGYYGHRVVNRGYYGGHHGYYGRRYRNNGGAVAAGLIGGLALGALATSSYNYGYGGYGGYAPVTYGYGYAPARSYGYAPVSYGYGDCFIERRVRVNRFGERVIRDVQVCR
jgi:hypothetical protein